MLIRIKKELTEQHSELYGNCSKLYGDLNTIPIEERKNKPNIEDWVE